MGGCAVYWPFLVSSLRCSGAVSSWISLVGMYVCIVRRYNVAWAINRTRALHPMKLCTRRCTAQNGGAAEEIAARSHRYNIKQLGVDFMWAYVVVHELYTMNLGLLAADEWNRTMRSGAGRTPDRLLPVCADITPSDLPIVVLVSSRAQRQLVESRWKTSDGVPRFPRAHNRSYSNYCCKEPTDPCLMKPQCTKRSTAIVL
ncbi:hypothetical protein BDV09DRAFT_175367 [Aspergillus tetrazonus]